MMKKAITTNITLILIALSALTACTHTPFTRYKSPEISGHIVSQGSTAAGIHLYLSINSGDSHCARYISEAVSNDKGQFSIHAIKEKMDYTPLMTHYLDEWTLCADISGARTAIYSNNRYGMGSVITSINLLCDLKNVGVKKSACHNSTL